MASISPSVGLAFLAPLPGPLLGWLGRLAPLGWEEKNGQLLGPRFPPRLGLSLLGRSSTRVLINSLHTGHVRQDNGNKHVCGALFETVHTHSPGAVSSRSRSVVPLH